MRLVVIGCLALMLDSCGNYVEVDPAKQVVVAKEEYERLKTAEALSKQIGRYQLHRVGVRTWRLDTVTGRNCLLLTSQSDWDSPEGKLQGSCAQEDATKKQIEP